MTKYSFFEHKRTKLTKPDLPHPRVYSFAKTQADAEAQLLFFNADNKKNEILIPLLNEDVDLITAKTVENLCIVSDIETNLLYLGIHSDDVEDLPMDEFLCQIFNILRKDSIKLKKVLSTFFDLFAWDTSDVDNVLHISRINIDAHYRYDEYNSFEGIPVDEHTRIKEVSREFIKNTLTFIPEDFEYVRDYDIFMAPSCMAHRLDLERINCITKFNAIDYYHNIQASIDKAEQLGIGIPEIKLDTLPKYLEPEDLLITYLKKDDSIESIRDVEVLGDIIGDPYIKIYDYIMIRDNNLQDFLSQFDKAMYPIAWIDHELNIHVGNSKDPSPEFRSEFKDYIDKSKEMQIWVTGQNIDKIDIKPSGELKNFDITSAKTLSEKAIKHRVTSLKNKEAPQWMKKVV